MNTDTSLTCATALTSTSGTASTPRPLKPNFVRDLTYENRRQVANTGDVQPVEQQRRREYCSCRRLIVDSDGYKLPPGLPQGTENRDVTNADLDQVLEKFAGRRQASSAPPD